MRSRRTYARMRPSGTCPRGHNSQPIAQEYSCAPRSHQASVQPQYPTCCHAGLGRNCAPVLGRTSDQTCRVPARGPSMPQSRATTTGMRWANSYQTSQTSRGQPHHRGRQYPSGHSPQSRGPWCHHQRDQQQSGQFLGGEQSCAIL